MTKQQFLDAMQKFSANLNQYFATKEDILPGVQAVRVELWNGQLYTQDTSVNLVDDYSHYDYILAYIGYNNNSGNVNFGVGIMDASEENAMIVDGSLNYNTFVQYSAYLEFTGASSKLALIQNIDSNVYIKKIEGIKFVQPNSYSTNEKIIGTWIDGRPLYQKTIADITGIANAYKAVDLSDLSIDKIVSFEGIILSNSEDCVPINFYHNSNDTTAGYFDKLEESLYIKHNNVGYNNCNFYVTIKYVKESS